MPRYAAIDLGSNSIRMLVAEVGGGKTQILSEDRQVTRLGSSVFLEGQITNDAIDFVCSVLRRMAETIKAFDVLGIRAVATSAVRDSANQEYFIERAEEALGAPVEIISGQEEARLIHLGVQARWPHPDKRLLTIDVGGGSTEFILSEHGRLATAFSKPLGAVRLTEVFLKNDPPTALELHQMREYIDEKLDQPIERITPPFDRAIATSATAAAIVCAVNGIPRMRRTEADRKRATTPDLRKLYQDLTMRDLAARRKVLGIGPRRAELIIAGAAVFLRAAEAFDLGSIYYSVAGVRDGVIADLVARGVGRELSQLSSDQRHTVEEMARRYGVQIEHARKVAELAHELFVALQPLHKLPPPYGKLLEATGYLHDIGHYVSDTGHHKHSYYLVANSDMPGFTDSERQFIAALCRYHRKSNPSPKHSFFQAVDTNERRAVVLLTPLLRLADSLDRGHEQRVQKLRVEIRNGHVVIGLETNSDTDLELWAAARMADLFRSTYNLPLMMAQSRS
jgi:exopolyphosphatase/guanosine-5'-triphosphate,3'-diphosphate pyrophosphatase